MKATPRFVSKSQEQQPAARAGAERDACSFSRLSGEDLPGDPHYSFLQPVFRNLGTGSRSDQVPTHPLPTTAVSKAVDAPPAFRGDFRYRSSLLLKNLQQKLKNNRASGVFS